MAIDRSFIGRGWAFPPTFDKAAKGVVMVSDLEDICQSLTILLDTTLGERIMQPEYGASLKDMLFEPIDSAIIVSIEDIVRTAIIYHEARIELLGVSAIGDRYLEGFININIDFRVKTTNSRFNFVYPFYLIEGTDIGLTT